METIKLAWRNIWRNRRRTLITSASVFFAVFLALLMRAFQLGSYDLMVYNIVHAYSGYFQVHAKGYWDDKIINNSFSYDEPLKAKIDGIRGITGYAPRLESFSLASFGIQTKGVIVNGIEPEPENELTGLKKKLIDGNYLDPGDNGVLIGSKLAGFLKIRVGDTLVLIGQGYHGASAAGIFPVRGIIRFPSPELDNRMVYLSLPAAQSLFTAEGFITSLSFNVSDPDDYPHLARHLTTALGEEYEVMTWKEMMPEVVQQIEADNASGIIMLGILYMIVGFGILGTVLMMINERRREFGMLVAVGMQKIKLVRVVLMELFFIGFLGMGAGLVVAIPLILYFYIHPIPLTGEMAQTTIQMGFEPLMPTAWEASYFIWQTVTVSAIIMVVMILPVVRISRLKVIDAMRK